MANVKSAIKRARQNVKRRERNSTLKAKARTEAKKALVAIQSAKSSDEATKALRDGEKALQKAVSKGVLPKERASRKTARLAQILRKKFPSATSARA